MKNLFLSFLLLCLVLGACGCYDASARERPGATAQTQAQSQSKATDQTVKPIYSKSGYDITPLPRARVEELAKKLSPAAYKITQQADTERPFCGTLLDNHKEGMYVCVVCGLPLFSSDSKFNSGTGWPSFFQPFDPDHVAQKTDSSLGMARTEINCARCNSHLGHVFDDGPKPTGLRFCLNSESLNFIEKGKDVPAESQPVKTETAYFAGGCFWGIEHYFQQGPGVVDAVSGYMQGKVEKPTYEQVSSHTTGHAETVKVVYDPKRITFKRLLQAFFVMHDPTELNRQGPDVGDNYRSGIFYVNEDQKREAEAYIKQLTDAKKFGNKPIVTQVEAAKTFWPAEDYHQDYVDKTGRPCHIADPW